MKRSDLWRGPVVASIAVLFFGLAGVLGKISALPAPLIVLGRVLFAAPALLAICLFQRLNMRPRRVRDGFVLPGLGILLAIHWTTFFQSIVVSNVAIGLLSFSSFPLFTAVLEPLLLHQRPGRLMVLASLLILPGIYLLVPSFTFQDRTTLGVFWGVFSGATFALLSVANRGLGERYPSIVLSLYQDGVATIVLLPTLLLIPTTAPQWTLQALGILLFLGLICTALAHTLFIASLRHMTVQSASLIASLEPVWGIIFGILLLGELPTVRTLLGGLLIVAAVLLPALPIKGMLRPSVSSRQK